MRVPRLTAVAALAALLVVGAACRADPTVAAYVGDLRITEAEIDQAVSGRAEIIAAELGPDPEPAEQRRARGQLAQVREQAVLMRVFIELAQPYADAEELAVPPPDPAAAAEALGLTPDDPFVQLAAAEQALQAALREHAQPVPASPTDQRRAYDELVAAGLTEAPFEQVVTELGDELDQLVGLRDLIQELAEGSDLQINPRYQLIYRVPLSFAGAEIGVLGVPLSDPALFR